MDASIIAVGTELLFGQTVNTNATFISRELNLMGFNVMYHFVVGDNPGRLKRTIETAYKDTDIIVLTGGLGPTQDDLTKETVAEVFGTTLKRDDACYNELMGIFKRSGREMTENNLKQANIPVGGKAFINHSGTAPGFAIEKNGKCAVCFPGPPREVKWLYENGIKDYLMHFVNKKMYYKVIRTIGIGESSLETRLLPLIDGQKDPTIATYAKEGECTLRVASKRNSLDEAKEAVDDMISQIDKLIGDYIYSYDDLTLNEVVVKKLKEKNYILSSAESCTGGLFAGSITDVPGASEVFSQGFVTYSEEAKIQELGVSQNTIDQYSVVSNETAIEMAKGARAKTNSDIGISITGYAGPDGGPNDNPGLCYIGFSSEKKSGSVMLNTKRNNRKWNRDNFVLNMMKVLNDLMDNKL